jgi:hypothetical protein
MSNDKHTPTPWMVVESKNRNETDIISDQNYIAQLKHFSDDDITFDRLVFMNGKGKRVADPIESIGKANAARIVQCVNEYDGLMAKIELLKDSHREYLLVRSNLRDLTNDYNAAQSELATLRAEKAELIEALKLASTRFGYLALYDNTERNGVIPTVGMNDIDRTLAKYETK